MITARLQSKQYAINAFAKHNDRFRGIENKFERATSSWISFSESIAGLRVRTNADMQVLGSIFGVPFEITCVPTLDSENDIFGRIAVFTHDAVSGTRKLASLFLIDLHQRYTDPNGRALFNDPEQTDDDYLILCNLLVTVLEAQHYRP